MEKETAMKTSILPTIALRGLTVFPNMLIHFDVGRESSIKALEEAMSTGVPVFLVAQRDISVERPGAEDLYQVGTISNVRQLLRMPGDNVRVMVEGVCRARLIAMTRRNPYLETEVQEIPAEPAGRPAPKTEALIRSTYEVFQRYAELAPKVSPDLLVNVLSSDDPGYISDYIAQNISMRPGDKQAILEELRPARRLERMYQILRREVEVLAVDVEIQNRAREQMADNQRDYYLREQMKAIQNELGEGDGDDIADYRKKIAETDLPDQVRQKLEKEVGRLAKQPFGSSEASVLRNYLDICLELPWNKRTKERVSVEAARKALDRDHYGLQKVKERILEFLAVKQLAPELKGQVICLVGPPGVGKTSIAMSVAGALNRKLARISLGGVSDEADIRGHRKTYVGSMPGRIIAAVNQAGSCNPLLLLDEIDKLGHDHRGDPASALLEVLDGEQNATFRDHFLELPFDQAPPDPQGDEAPRLGQGPAEDHRRRHPGDDRLLHPGVRGAHPGAPHRRSVPQGGHEAGVRRGDRRAGPREGLAGVPGRAPLPPGAGGPQGAGRRGQRPGLDQRGRRAAGGGGQRGPRHRQGGADGQLGRRDEGVRPRGPELYPQPLRPAGHRPQILPEQ